MKKLIPFLVLLVGTASAFAQGIVNFNNNVLISTNPGAPSVLVRLPDMSTPVAGTGYVARLLYSTDGGASFIPHTANPSLFRPVGVAPAGTWIGGNRTLAGAGGVGIPVMLMVQSWDRTGNPALTFDEARQQGRLWGVSDVYIYTQRQSIPSSPADQWMHEFRGFSMVPEPSVIGLGLIGAGALFFLRRRKS